MLSLKIIVFYLVTATLLCCQSVSQSIFYFILGTTLRNYHALMLLSYE
jgi:hypothetical protein